MDILKKIGVMAAGLGISGLLGGVSAVLFLYVAIEAAFAGADDVLHNTIGTFDLALKGFGPLELLVVTGRCEIVPVNDGAKAALGVEEHARRRLALDEARTNEGRLLLPVL